MSKKFLISMCSQRYSFLCIRNVSIHPITLCLNWWIMLPNAMNSLIVRNNDTHHYNTRQNHHLRGSRPTCKPAVNRFSNRSVQIWNAISRKLNINVYLYKFKYYDKLFLLENELKWSLIITNSSIVWQPIHESVTFDFVLNII